jgi:hypothetical protein
MTEYVARAALFALSRWGDSMPIWLQATLLDLIDNIIQHT